MNQGASAPLFFKPPSSTTITGHTPMTPTTSYKHLSIRNGVETVTEHYEPVTKHTRAGKNGKNIMCPACNAIHRVYHFAWSAASCPSCKRVIYKDEYLVDQLDTWRTPR